MFRRTRSTVLKAAETPSWQVLRGTHEGGETYARFNTAFSKASDRAGYPIQIGVAIPLNEPDEHGLPMAAEMEELAGIEELIVHNIGMRPFWPEQSPPPRCESSCCTPTTEPGSNASTSTSRRRRHHIASRSWHAPTPTARHTTASVRDSPQDTRSQRTQASIPLNHATVSSMPWTRGVQASQPRCSWAACASRHDLSCSPRLAAAMIGAMSTPVASTTYS